MSFHNQSFDNIGTQKIPLKMVHVVMRIIEEPSQLLFGGGPHKVIIKLKIFYGLNIISEEVKNTLQKE